MAVHALWTQHLGRRGKRRHARLVKRVLCKHKDPSSDPQHSCKRPGCGAYLVTLGLGRQGQEAPGANWPTNLAELINFRFSKSCLGKKKGGGMWLRAFAAPSENPHFHIEAHMNMYTQLYSKFKVSLGYIWYSVSKERRGNSSKAIKYKREKKSTQ